MIDTHLFSDFSSLGDLASLSDIERFNVIKGPLFELALLLFVFGLTYKLVRILMLGIPPERAKPKGNPALSAFKMLGMKPFYVFGFGDVVAKRTGTFVNGILFHLFFLLLIFFIPWHAFVWEKMTGVAFPYVSAALSNIFAYGALVTLLLLWLSRMLHPVTRLLTGKDEHVANFLIVLTLVTGIVANKWAGEGIYPTLLGAHILAAEVLIVYIPFSRLSHFMTYPVSLLFYGRSIGISGARE